MCSNIIIKGHQGLGDNLYMRPFVRAACEQKTETIFLETPWPQLFWDIAEAHDLKFLKRQTRLRTQLKNENRFGSDVYSAKPCCADQIKLNYGRQDLRDGIGMVGSIECGTSLAIDGNFDFNVKLDWLTEVLCKLSGNCHGKLDSKALAVVRPPTLRSDYRNKARNPCPKAMQEAIDALSDTHYLISVADLEADAEWLDGPQLRGIDLELHNGELNTEEMLALCSMADLLVGGPGFIIPLGIALHVKTFIVFGGFHPPAAVTDPRMNLDRFAYAAPEPFCACFDEKHDCNKEINTAVMVDSLADLIEEKVKA